MTYQNIQWTWWLKVQMRTGEHTFREDVYMCTLKYRRWNHDLRPFQSLKMRVANIFWKWNSLSDDSRGTSTQTINNYVESEEGKSVSTNSKRDNVHSNWSELLSVKKKQEMREHVEANQSLMWLPHLLLEKPWRGLPSLQWKRWWKI